MGSMETDKTQRALPGPSHDPTPIFELFRGSYGSELLTAAVAHFGVFKILHNEALSLEALGARLELKRRPMVVLTTALRAMGFLNLDSSNRLCLADIAREHLVFGNEFFVGDYVGLAASSPGVQAMVERLRSDAPADIDGAGAAFIYRDGMKSAMESAELARHFTLALSGRAKNVAPVLAERLPMEGVKHVLDVGGGTGIYSIALLRKYSELKASVVDLPHVLEVAREFAADYGVEDRVTFIDADMFTFEAGESQELVLLSNILHDWGEETCRDLVAHYGRQLTANGRLVVHDVFLNDSLDGPLPIALYSAALFTLTEGRAYSMGEYRGWLEQAGLTVETPIETLIHCGALVGTRLGS
jgi:predicted O-methyltransferase YrrM